MTRITVTAWIGLALLSGVASGDVPGRVHVVARYRDDLPRHVVEARVDRLVREGLAVDYRFHTIPAVLLSVAPDEAAALKSGRHADVFRHVGGDVPVELGYMPDDPRLAEQWWAHNDGSLGHPHEDVAAARAWDLETGDAGVIVAVIDRGLDVTHPDIAANCLPGYDFVNMVPGVPRGDHGTQCAGLIGAVGDNGEGIAGVCWDVTILPLAMYHISDCVAAIDSATALGVDVISNSWSIGIDDLMPWMLEDLLDVLDAATAAGVIVVNSAGNDGLDLDLPGNETYPASYDHPLNLAVANTKASGLVNASSNRGAGTVDIAAPGTAILTTTVDGFGDWDYVYVTGTSFASPLVAGAAALLKARHPGLAPAEVVARILDGAERLPQIGGAVAGDRRLNLFRALDRSDRTPPAPLADLAAVGIDSDRIELTWTCPGDDGLDGALDHYEVWYQSGDGASPFGIGYVLAPVAAAGETETHVLTGLVYGRAYIVAVVAVDDDRNRSVSATSAVSTLPPPSIAVGPASLLVYGRTGGVETAEVVVRNEGVGTLRGEWRVPEGTSWVSVEPSGFVIPGGDSLAVTVRLDLSGVCDPVRQIALGVTHNDPFQHDLEVDLVAITEGAPEISGSAVDIAFDETGIHSARVEPLVLRNVGCGPLAVTGARLASGEQFRVSTVGGSLAPGDSTLVEVTFLPTALGRHEDVLLVDSDSPDDPALAVLLSGRAAPDLGPARPLLAVPNPFNPTTEIYALPAVSGAYELGIHDLRGRLVRRFRGVSVESQVMSLGWEGTDADGAALPSGVYLCRLTIDGRPHGRPLKIHLVR